MIRYVLFDLDGTLADTSGGILDSIAKAAEQLGLTDRDPANMKKFIGPPLKPAFMEYYGLDEAAATEAVKVFRGFYSESGKYICELYDGMEQALSILKKEGYRLFVATSKPTVFATEILSKLKIDHYFEDIVGSNLDNTRSKKCEVIDYILQTYHITEIQKAVMIGDKAQDLIGAEQCGVHGIGVTFGFGSREELEGVKHDVLLDSPMEIVTYLRGN